MMPAATATASVNATQIERDLIEARHRDAIPDEGEQTAMAQCGNADPGDAAAVASTTLSVSICRTSDCVPLQAPSACRLRVRAQASSEQQIRNIHARDEQHEDHGSGERENGLNLVNSLATEQHDGPAGIAPRLFLSRSAMRACRLYACSNETPPRRRAMAMSCRAPRTRPELLQRLPAADCSSIDRPVKRGGITPITVLGRQPC